MTRPAPDRGRRERRGQGTQRGVVLLFALISVLIVMIAAVALIRSFNSSLFSAGNIAFKRDLQNESELAIQAVMTDFRAGGLLDARSKRTVDVPAANYSATALLQATQVNHQSIPLALQSEVAMTSPTYSTSGFTKTKVDVPGTGVSYRYIIERLCDLVGDETALGTAHCMIANAALPGGQGNDQKNAGVNPAGSTCGSGPCQSAQSLNVVYRITVRLQGPRNTLSFFQSTITAP